MINGIGQKIIIFSEALGLTLLVICSSSNQTMVNTQNCLASR
jgi:hypothetical protein